MVTKIDFKKELKHLYGPSAREFQVIEVPAMQFLMIDGQGDPNTAPAYQAALATLYPVAYALKFLSKNELDRDYKVPPLEGLWWAEDMAVFRLELDKGQWQWTAMIMTPDWITPAHFESALRQAEGKNPPALDRIRLETYREGLSVQILHNGPFDAEGPTLHRLHHEFLPAHDYVENGRHHEIYLSDFRRTAAEKLKTVLRQPVRKA